MIFDLINLTCASGETEALSNGQPDVQMEEQVETDKQSEEQQASLNIICDGVTASTKQLMKEVRSFFFCQTRAMKPEEEHIK